MSTIKSSDEHLTLNADGSSKDIKFQANGVEKASISSSGAFTSTTIDATKLTGTIPNFTSTGIDDNATSTAITIDANENVGIGVTPESWYSSYKALQIGNTGTLFKDNVNGGDFSIGNNFYLNSTPAYAYTTTAGASRHSQENGVHYFQVAPSGSADAAITWTTAMTIDNIACTMVGNNQENNSAAGYSSSTPHLSCSGNGYASLTVRRTSDTGACVNFFGSSSSSSTVGNITVSGSSTSYNTSSDYRLKENVDYTWDATTRLKQLKPARFNFIADDTNTLVDGFIAHEVQDIVPEAVSGEKDAMIAEVLYVEGDELPEGKSIGDVKTAATIDPQGIDQSKLVPLLVKTIQELEARIAALEA